ncbi:MAG: putative Ig domain-containing protein [Candidatus Margulisiibacteriota bacterium]
MDNERIDKSHRTSLLVLFFFAALFLLFFPSKGSATDNLLLWNGEVMREASYFTNGVCISSEAYQNTWCFNGTPYDGYHSPVISLTNLPSWRSDISAYDEIWFYAKCDQEGKTFSFDISGWPYTSNFVSIEAYIDGGSLDATYRLVRIPISALKTATYELGSIERIFFNPDSKGFNIYIDDIWAVKLSNVNPESSPLIGNYRDIIFADTNVKSASTETLTVTNIGNQPLIVSGISLEGTDKDSFSVSLSGFTIGADSSRSMPVTFNPTAHGNKTANIIINHNATVMGSTHTVVLRGKGMNASLAVSQNSLDFGKVPVGSGMTWKLNVSNLGNVALNVSNIVSSNELFYVTPAAFTLESVSTEEVYVTFTPTVEGVQSGMLTIFSNDINVPQATIFMSAEGIASLNPAVLPLSTANITSSTVDLSWGTISGANKINIFVGPEPPETVNGPLPLKFQVASLDAGQISCVLTNLVAADDIFIRIESLNGDSVLAAGNTHIRTIGGPRAQLNTPVREVHMISPNTIMIVLQNKSVKSYCDSIQPPTYIYSNLTGYTGALWQAGPWTVKRADGTAINVDNVFRHSIAVGNPVYTYDPVNGGFSADNSTVDVDHNIYLKLAQDVGTREVLIIRGPQVSTTYDPMTSSLEVIVPFSDRYLETPVIQLNQVGYCPSSTKRYAYISGWLGDGGALSLADFPNNADVLIDNEDKIFPRSAVVNGVPINLRSASDTDSGGAVDEIDLSSVPAAEGRFYRVRIPGVGVSWPTQISYSGIFKAFYVVSRGMYYNRWGRDLRNSNWADEWAGRSPDHPFVYTADIPGQGWGAPFSSVTSTQPPLTGRRELSGGHHDAGDWDQYPSHFDLPTYLMQAYEGNPQGFVDGQLSIPESGNGIPDILDEALYGIKAWEQLQEDDGGIRAGVEWFNDGAPWNYADLDSTPYWTYVRDPHVTIRFCGVFAQASHLIAPFDKAKSDELLDRAIRAYNWAVSQGVDETWTSGMACASSQLFRATGDDKYAKKFETILDISDSWHSHSVPISRNLSYIDTTSWKSGMTTPIQWGLCPTDIIGYIDAGKVDKSKWYYSSCINKIENIADTGLDNINTLYAHRNGRWSGWGTGWGQGTAIGQYVMAMFSRIKFNNLAPLSSGKLTDYHNAISLSADYMLGANPNGMIYITGLGSRSVKDPLHADAITYKNYGYDLIPGITAFGPANPVNKSHYRYSQYTFYPKFEDQPLLRKYADVRAFVNNDEGGAGLNAIDASLMGMLLPPGLLPVSDIAPLGSDHKNSLAPKNSVINSGIHYIPPVAGRQTVRTNKNIPLSIKLYGYDFNGYQISTCEVTQQPLHGTLSISGSDEAIYSPDTDYSGADSLLFKVNNGYSDSAPSMVSIEVYARSPYVIRTSTRGAGCIFPSGEVQVCEGDNLKFYMSPTGSQWHTGDVSVDGVSVGAVSDYTFASVEADHTISATFAINTYTITVLAGAGGTITPSSDITVDAYTTKTFNITAESGLLIKYVKIDNVSTADAVGVSTYSYTFKSVTKIHTIEAAFSGSIESYTVNSSSPQTAGVGFSNTVLAKDGVGDIASWDSWTVVNLSSNSPNLQFYSNSTYDTATNEYKLINGQFSYYAKDNSAETVTITATDENGKIGTSETIVINAFSVTVPTAEFSAVPLSGIKPLNVAFTNTSTGVVTSELWKFGDSATTAETSPTHWYNTAGTYTVTLEVTGPGGTSVKTMTNYIAVNEPPVGVPIAPGNLTAAGISSSEIDLSWTDNATNESGYRIARSSNGMTFTAIASPAANSTSYSNTGLSAHTRYYYKVCATNEAGDSAYSNIVSLETLNTSPVLVHIGSKTTSEGQTLIFTVSATDENNDAITYEAVTLPSGANFNITSGLFSWTPDYTQANTYNVTFKARDGYGGISQESITIIVNNLSGPLAPSNLTAVGITSSRIDLSWTDNATNELGYRIARSPNGTVFTAIASPAANSTSYSNTGLSPHTRYYYKVCATSEGGDSAFSNIASAETLNMVPVLTHIGNKTTSEGNILTFTVSATDEDRDTLTYESVTLPSGATFNATSGLFNWSPSYSQSGSYPVTFKARDAYGGISQETITITVNNVVRTYSISAIAGAGGTIEPSGLIAVTEGGSRVFSISAESGYEIVSIKVDGTSIGMPSSYTFNNVAADHSIEAVFEKVSVASLGPEKPMAGAFSAVTSTVIVANWGSGGSGTGTKYYCENTTAGTNSGWIEGTSYTNRGLTPDSTYSFRVKARNLEGIESEWTLLGEQKTGGKKDFKGIKAEGRDLLSGDIISSKLKVNVEIEGGVSLETLDVYVDGVKMTSAGTKGKETIKGLEYTAEEAIPAGEHSIRIEATDTEGNVYERQITGIMVTAAGVQQIVGSVLGYPNPYDANAGNLRISYTLTNDMDVMVYIFNVVGKVVSKGQYMSGTMGGLAGYNEVTWDGKDMFGVKIENGAYLIRVLEKSTSKQLGKCNVMVVKR